MGEAAICEIFFDTIPLSHWRDPIVMEVMVAAEISTSEAHRFIQLIKGA